MNEGKRVVVVLFALALIQSGSAQRAWRLLDTRPFAGKAEGVVGALGVSVEGLRETEIRGRARWMALAWDARLRRQRPRVFQWLKRFGVWGEGQRLGIDLLIVPTDDPRRGRKGWGTGRLQFRFENFPPQLEGQIRDFLERAMPLLTEIYGPPFSSPPDTTRTVTVVLDELLDALDGGVYDAVTDTVRIPEFDPDRGFDWFNLIHQLFHAFRGRLVLSFPAWEEGMARAAALLASVRLRHEGFPEFANFDPKDPIDGDPLWVLPLYDLLNQPPLGNPVFLPPSGFQPMAFWRVGMSAAAWLKVAAEDPQFFRKFNGAFLSAPDPETIRGDTIALIALTASLVPNVEGQSFWDWYRRQHVLNTGVSVGPKLYVFSIPLHIGILLILNHYRTTADGDEQPLNGLATLVYRNDQSDDLFAEEGNEADIVDGEGFIAPQFFNIGGANLVFVDIFVNGLTATIPFPYMVRGEEGNENPIWGGVFHALRGTVMIDFEGMAGLEATVTRGVFTVKETLDLGRLYRLKIRHRWEEGAETEERRNGAFDFSCLLIHARPSITRFEVTLSSGIHLFSVPVFPVASDEAQALGLPPDELLLARWNPRRPGTFKYEFYPRITTPMMPGVGYWLKLFREKTLRVQGTPLPFDEIFQVPLFGGFNQVGNPFPRDLSVDEIFVVFGNETPVDLTAAEGRQWVQKTIWIWTKETGYQIAQTVRAWQGFWVRALRPNGVRLVFNWGRRRSALRGQRAPQKPERIWSVRIVVEAPGSPPDRENFFGVVAGKRGVKIFKPPMVPGTVWAALVAPDRKAEGEGYAKDLRGQGERKRWLLAIRSDLKGPVPVTLRWEGLAKVPSSIRLIATDLMTGEQFSLRHRSAYTVIMEGGEERRFLITAKEGFLPPLVRITHVRPLRGRGILIRLSLTAPAQVRLEVLTMTGRLVQVVTDRFFSPSPHLSLLWERRGRQNRRLPSGFYLLRVIARDGEGRLQQAVRTVMVR